MLFPISLLHLLGQNRERAHSVTSHQNDAGVTTQLLSYVLPFQKSYIHCAAGTEFEDECFRLEQNTMS